MGEPPDGLVGAMVRGVVTRRGDVVDVVLGDGRFVGAVVGAVGVLTGSVGRVAVPDTTELEFGGEGAGPRSDVEHPAASRPARKAAQSVRRPAVVTLRA